MVLSARAPLVLRIWSLWPAEPTAPEMNARRCRAGGLGHVSDRSKRTAEDQKLRRARGDTESTAFFHSAKGQTETKSQRRKSRFKRNSSAATQSNERRNGVRLRAHEKWEFLIAVPILIQLSRLCAFHRKNSRHTRTNDANVTQSDSSAGLVRAAIEIG